MRFGQHDLSLGEKRQTTGKGTGLCMEAHGGDLAHRKWGRKERETGGDKNLRWVVYESIVMSNEAQGQKKNTNKEGGVL